jgi:hypothetical protein
MINSKWFPRYKFAVFGKKWIVKNSCSVVTVYSQYGQCTSVKKKNNALPRHRSILRSIRYRRDRTQKMRLFRIEGSKNLKKKTNATDHLLCSQNTYIIKWDCYDKTENNFFLLIETFYYISLKTSYLSSFASRSQCLPLLNDNIMPLNH